MTLTCRIVTFTTISNGDERLRATAGRFDDESFNGLPNTLEMSCERPNTLNARQLISFFGVTLLPSEPRPLPDTPRDRSREPLP